MPASRDPSCRRQYDALLEAERGRYGMKREVAQQTEFLGGTDEATQTAALWAGMRPPPLTTLEISYPPGDYLYRAPGRTAAPDYVGDAAARRSAEHGDGGFRPAAQLLEAAALRTRPGPAAHPHRDTEAANEGSVPGSSRRPRSAAGAPATQPAVTRIPLVHADTRPALSSATPTSAHAGEWFKVGVGAPGAAARADPRALVAAGRPVAAPETADAAPPRASQPPRGDVHTGAAYVGTAAAGAAREAVLKKLAEREGMRGMHPRLRVVRAREAAEARATVTLEARPHVVEFPQRA